MHGIGAKAASLNHASAAAGGLARCAEQKCTIGLDVVAALGAFEVEVAVEKNRRTGKIGHGMSLFAHLRGMAGGARKAVELAGENTSGARQGR